jgi:hypothetical protein
MHFRAQSKCSLEYSIDYSFHTLANLRSFFLRIAFCVLAFGVKVVDKSAWSKHRGNMGKVEIASYKSQLSAECEIQLSNKFAERHDSTTKLLQCLSELPTSRWKVNVFSGTVPNVVDKAKPSKSRLRRQLYVITDVSSAFACVRLMRRFDRVPALGSKYFQQLHQSAAAKHGF